MIMFAVFLTDYKLQFAKCVYRNLIRFSSTTRIIQKDILLAPAYRPEIVEQNKYDKWEKNGMFRADIPSNKPTFSMVLPPPNVTGKLHLGHALAGTVQDVIARQQRSLGYNVLWMPGTDHAGIATQGVVERYLKKRYGINRQDISRERFNNEVWQWKSHHGNAICEQLRSLGFSLDWPRHVFTMDAKHTAAVNDAFIKLFKKGLIYRKKGLVNWCHKLRSTVSDIEVENLTIDQPTEIKLHCSDGPVKFGLLYEIIYKIVDNDESIVVSTTTPETMLGDTAIAVNPTDKRYAHLRGKRAVHPFRNTTIPIIFDEFVDMALGTGAVKITPAHSKVDYDVAKKHNLPLIQVINEDRLIINSDNFNGINRYECREILINRLNDMNLLRNINPHKMTLPVCSRTGDVIEYLPKEQWFLSCKELSKKAAKCVENNQLVIMPDKFVKNWLEWTEHDRDWCISRQIWWGHQIPAYKCTADHNVVWVAATNEATAKIQASKYLRTLPALINVDRDTDVLDTWFSSGIYPFASLGWPEHYNEDYRTFFPLALMATGHDILGLWVQRMVMLSLELTKKLPFENILFHGIICDNKGAKMSKSKGNVLDPIDIIDGITMTDLRKKTESMNKDGILTKEELEKALSYQRKTFSKHDGIPECGVDALRFTLLTNDIKSHFINFDLDQCYANKLFCNKIWQSVKYLDNSFAKLKPTDFEITHNDLTYFDCWILSKLAEMVCIVNESMNMYDFHIATKAIRAFIYNEFCDVYLEATKPGFEKTLSTVGYAHAHTLSAALNTSLRCLAPFMVYLTDELIPKIPAFERNIIYNFEDMFSKYYIFPKYEDFKVWKNKEIENKADMMLNLISLVRQLKGIYNISSKLNPAVYIETNNEALKSDIYHNKGIMLHLCKCGAMTYFKNTKNTYISGMLDKDTKVYVELVGEDIASQILKARASIEKRIKKMENHLTKLEAKINSDHYLRTVSEDSQLIDKETLETKKEELKRMQRFIV